MGKLKAIILAAGKGTRMKSDTPKVLHEILGKPLIEYIVTAAKQAGVDDVIAVISDPMVEEKIKGVSFAMQHEPQGTGHAVMCAKHFIGDDDTIIILYGDAPLVRGAEIKDIFRSHIASKAQGTVVSAIVNDAAGYGRVVRNNGIFEKIVEHRDATPEQLSITEINTGLYCFNGTALKKAFTSLKPNNSQNEYYLTDVMEIIKGQGLAADIYISKTPEDYAGINDRYQLSQAAKTMQHRINKEHMISGVTIVDSDTTFIGADVKIGQDTVILPGCIIEGSTEIGAGCDIGPNCRFTDMKIGSRCHIQNSVATTSVVGNGVNIGPFAYIRPNSQLCDNVKIGDFVEVKNSVVGVGSKASHLAYIGDSDVGSGVNFGCGAITVNYDGKNKGRTTICDNAFVGSNSNLVAPVVIGEYGYVAAGSTITHDVPAGCLAFGRARQVNKDGRAKNQS